MSGPFVNQGYTRAVAIVTSATVNFDGSTATASAGSNSVAPTRCDAIWVGGAGIVVAVFPDGTAAGTTVNFTCVAGTPLPVQAIRVNVTNTTATLMVALYKD